MSHRMSCKHERWAREREYMNGGELVMGPNKPCPWCARDSGKELVDGMMSKLVDERNDLRARAEASEKACAEMRAALEAYTYNGHHATGVAEGKHVSSGFCKTCADQYVAAQAALSSDAGKNYVPRELLLKVAEAVNDETFDHCPGCYGDHASKHVDLAAIIEEVCK